MAASCDSGVPEGPVPGGPISDDRVIRLSVKHWGFPQEADTTVTWEPLRVGRDTVAGSTCGIWRARVASPSASISLIVKILHRAETGSLFWPASEKPSDPMYWRREADALRAFEHGRLPGPFQAGRCRVAHERDDHHIELWHAPGRGVRGSRRGGRRHGPLRDRCSRLGGPDRRAALSGSAMSMRQRGVFGSRRLPSAPRGMSAATSTSANQHPVRGTWRFAGAGLHIVRRIDPRQERWVLRLTRGAPSFQALG